jgi:hypothetical protein
VAEDLWLLPTYQEILYILCLAVAGVGVVSVPRALVDPQLAHSAAWTAGRGSVRRRRSARR